MPIRDLTDRERNKYEAAINGMDIGREDRIRAADMTFGYLREDTEWEDGGAYSDDITDLTVISAMNKYADNVARHMLDIYGPWASYRYVKGTDELAALEDEEEDLKDETLESYSMQVREAYQESNLMSSFRNSVIAMDTLGSGVIKVDYVRSNGTLAVQPIKPSAISWSKNSFGVADTIVHKQETTIERAIADYPGVEAYLKQYMSEYDRTPADDIDVTTYIYSEATNSIADGFRHLTMINEMVVEEVEKHPVNPYIVYSGDPNDYDQYGNSLVKDALPAIEQLYTLNENLTVGSTLRSQPSYVVQGDMARPPRAIDKNTIYTLQPGSTMQPMDYGSSIAYTFEDHRRLQDDLRIHFLDMDVPLDRIQNTTATAISGQQQSFIVRMSARVHNIDNGAIGPLLDVGGRLLIYHGHFEGRMEFNASNHVVDVSTNRELEVKAKSKLDVEQDKQKAAERLGRWTPVFEIVTTFNDLDPRLANLPDFVEIVKNYHSMADLGTNTLNKDEEVEQATQQQQQQQQEMMQQQIQQGA